MSGKLEQTLHKHRLAQRQRALRALLMRPVMTSSDPDFAASVPDKK